MRVTVRCAWFVCAATCLSFVACGGSSDTGSGGASTASNGTAGAGGASGGAGPGSGGHGASGPGGAGGATTGPGGGGSAPGDVGVWQDGPGACPAGLPKKDITTAAELASAARGEDAYAGDAPATCYFIHDGTYTDDGAIFYVRKGGVAGGDHRVFVGESRDGALIHGRGTIDDGVSDVTVTNLTFDLTGYPGSGAFNTLGVGNGKNVTIDHVTFTGDCATGLQGGHIETNGTDGLLLEACIIEKFGHCNGGGHEDHGIYLGSGKNLVIRNNIIRGNSSRGIQMYTQGGDYGTVDKVLVERNLIEGNGHADYEDGIVINSYGTGPITNITIQRNIFLRNYYSGIRFAGGLESGVTVSRNTFGDNGAGSSAGGRSEINVDDAGGAAGTMLATNLFEVGNTLINNCYDGASLGFSFGDNFVHGMVPSGAAGNCVGNEKMGDPQFADPAGGDFHPQNPAAQPYGAYAP